MQTAHPIPSRIADENTALRTILEGTATATGGRFFDALVTGLAYECSSKFVHIGGIAAATLVIYACGTGWLMYSLDLEFLPAFTAGVLPFIAGDAVKAGAAYMIAERLP